VGELGERLELGLVGGGVDAAQKGDALVVEPLGDGLVGGQHELLERPDG